MTRGYRDLVKRYWEFWAVSRGDREQRLAAQELVDVLEEVDEIVAPGDDAAIELIAELAEAAHPDDAALAYLGAGPVENLIRGADDETMARPESAIDRWGMRDALASVWITDSTPESRRRELELWFQRLGIHRDSD